MSKWNTVAILGVGLIGGSIGLALRRRGLVDEVVGIGRRAASLRVAREVGAATRTTTSIRRGVAEAELIVVCTPVELIPQQVREVAEHCPAGALVTDAGSTKAQIVSALDRGLPRNVRFLGSHPLAGSEKTGPGEAREDLLCGRLVVLTPTSHSRREDIERLTEFWSDLGARVELLSPAEHDRRVAASSHLPHLVASALAASIPDNCWPLAAGGLLDTTRVAGGDPELWRQILTDNRRQVLAALRPLQQNLTQLRKALQSGDDETLLEILALGQQNRRRADAPSPRAEISNGSQNR